MERFGNRNGMSLPAVMMTSALAISLVAALTTFLTNVQKGTRGVDLKLKSQDFGNLLRYSLAKPENCRSVLNIDANPIRIETTLLPSKAGTYTYTVPEIVLTNKPYRVGTTEGALKITNIDLVFPPAQPSGEFVASLNVALEAVGGAPSFGASHFVHTVPLQISVEPDGTLTAVKSCFMQSSLDGQATCASLGGRWLEGPFMPKNRCSMASDLVLALNELPDGIPANGDTSDSGERVQECYWQPQGGISVQTFSCLGMAGSLGGTRCHFDPTTKSWGVWAYGPSGPAARLWECSRGVKVSSTAPATEGLEWNDELHKAWKETSYDYLLEADRMPTVKRCKVAPDLDQWLDCSNSRTPDDALQGKAGSCLFARNINLLGFLGPISRYNEICQNAGGQGCTPIDPRNYSGWIRVTVPRFVSLQPTGGGQMQPVMKEAMGYPCFLTEVDKTLYADPNLSAPTTTPPTQAEATQPTNIKQCIMSLPAYEQFLPPVVSSASMRRTIIPCDNGPLTATSSDALRNSFGANRCWYLASLNASDPTKAIRIANHYEGTAYPYSPINRPFNEGWVNMQSYQLPLDIVSGLTPAKWLAPGIAANDYRLSFDSAFPNHANGYIMGNPCNVGVRVQK